MGGLANDLRTYYTALEEKEREEYRVWFSAV